MSIQLIPQRFQAIRQDNAEESGIHTLAFILSLLVGSVGAGGLVTLVGYYTPFLILGSVLMSVGAGLMYTLKPDASVGAWIGYQILVGIGVGVSLEQCNIAIQTVLPEEQVPAGISLGILVRSLGGTIAIAICQNVFQKKLQENLSEILPGLDISIISGSGATTLVENVQKVLGEERVAEVLALYNDAVVQTYLVGLVLAALTAPCCLLIEWKSVKKEKREKGEEDEAKDVEKAGEIKTSEGVSEERGGAVDGEGPGETKSKGRLEKTR